MDEKKRQDFFYDKNDIILAVAILLVAGLVIFWRINAIMDYPQTLAEATKTTVADTTEDTAVDSKPKADSTTNVSKDQAAAEEEATKGSEDTTSSTALWVKGKLSKTVKVRVQGGSATGAVQCLVDKGLFKSYNDFNKACKAAGTAATQIKASTFTLPKGSTRTDIVKKVT